MRQVTLLLLFHQTLANLFDIDKCTIDYRSLENMWEQKIVHDLQQCGYDPFEPPPQNSTEPFKVYLKFFMKTFKLNSERQEFSTYMWTFFKWQDDRLKWDPAKYDGLDEAILSSYRIWTPGVEPINSLARYYDVRYLYMPCSVDSTGEVKCFARLEFKVKCSTDLSEWPYDEQFCKLEFGTYSETGIELQLDVGNKAITMIGAEYGTEWDIMGYREEKNATLKKQLTMTFRLERHAGVMTAIVIYPSFILSALTLSTLLIDARRNVRLIVACFSCMCHFYFLSEMAADIPNQGKNPPRLLLLYRGSFVMTSILVFLSFIMNLICGRETVCPNWIISVNEYVNTKFLRYLIWPRWDTKVEEERDKAKYSKHWTELSNMINSVWIFVALIVYASMYSALMPHPISTEDEY